MCNTQGAAILTAQSITETEVDLEKTRTTLHHRICFLCCTLLIGLIPHAVQAQGFSTFNGRNHPELDWQQAETEHFKIMYPAHLAGIEIQAGVIAETTYTALSQNLDVTFDKKIRMYLSDEDEILNGFALSPLGYTNIWVHVNDVATTWSGNTKWLRTVISHELAHLFHGEAVKSRLGLISFFLGDPMPSFWAEGLAQYETELWDANRGDRWLRTAVLDDRLSYEDGRSIWNGRLLYASGNAQLRYLATQYGDSTITKILKHRKTAALGLFEHHDFYTAFEEVTGKSHAAFYDEWRRHMNVYYNTLAGQMELTDSLDAKPLKLPGQYLYDIRYNADTTHTAVLSLSSISRPVIRLNVIHRETSTSKTVAEGSIRAPIDWSPDGRQLAFARRTRQKNGALINDLFITSRDGKHTRRLTQSRRASSPVFSSDGKHLAFVGSAAGTANVFLYNIETGEERALTSFTGDVQLASIDWHHKSNKIVVGRFDADGDRDILLLDPETGTIDTLSPTGTDDQFPVWRPDGKQIAVTSLSDRVPNVFIWDLETRTRRRATNLINGAQFSTDVPVYNCCSPDIIQSQPTDASVTVGDSATFTVNSTSPNATFQWEINQGFTFIALFPTGQHSGDTTNALTIHNTNIFNDGWLYRCIVTENAHCIDTTDIVELHVDSATWVPELGGAQVQVYPNPASELVTIDLGEPMAGALRLVDLSGKMVLQQRLSAQRVQLQASDLPGKGAYIVELVSDSGTLIARKRIVFI